MASKHLLRLPSVPPFAFAICGARLVSSPSDFAIRLAQDAKRRGAEKVQRARTGRTNRRRRGRSLRGGDDGSRAKVKGQGSARRPPSGRNDFRKAHVTAEAVIYKAATRAKRTGGRASMASRREQLGSERDFEGNLKFETALLASLRDESATVEQTNACAGEAAQAVARCAVLGTQDFRPGLGACRAYGAEFFGWGLGGSGWASSVRNSK